jgi:hypothetical protein
VTAARNLSAATDIQKALRGLQFIEFFLFAYKEFKMKIVDSVLFVACCMIAIAITMVVTISKDHKQAHGQIEYPFGLASYDSCKAEIELEQRVLALDFRNYKITTRSDVASTLYRFTEESEELLLSCDNTRSMLVVSFRGADVLKRLDGKFGFVGPESKTALK